MSSPELRIAQWFNTDRPLSLADFRGRVLVLEAFQMLCPGCVLHGIPLVRSIQQTFPADEVAVIGLHSVFEHHAAMTPVSLAAFLHEYRITFPVGVDEPTASGLPATMGAYQMRGTPSLLLFDRSGELHSHHFGEVSPLRLGAEIGRLLAGAPAARGKGAAEPAGDQGCTDDGCAVAASGSMNHHPPGGP